MSQSTSPSTNGEVEKDIRVQETLGAVNWSQISNRACTFYRTESFEWGEVRAGGYNVIRFLHLHDAESTVLVARVPYFPKDKWLPTNSVAAFKRISSEVATMRYVEKHCSVPVPHVIEYSVEPEVNEVGSPFILMTNVEGVPLFTLWNDMEEEKRTVVLQQIVDILLELSLQRFDKIGSLVEVGVSDVTSSSDARWAVAEKVHLPTGEEDIERVLSSRAWTSAADYWTTYANARLARVDSNNFGDSGKQYEYGHFWFIRSLIPALYDPSLDQTGFPLLPGDFHSQNIMVKDVEGQPCITALIDWEFSSTQPTASFAQYPLFIMDHPYWDENDPRRQRNRLDQGTFNTLFRKAEARVFPNSKPSLTDTFACSQGVYLFEQLIQYPMFYSELYPQLFDHLFGPDSFEFSVDYFSKLLENGLLKEVATKHKEEWEVWKRAKEVLGDSLPGDLDRNSFVALCGDHMEKFPEDCMIRRWLAKRYQPEESMNGSYHKASVCW